MGFREEFLTALRSGEYRQTRGALRHGDCFCAGGVAVDLAIKNGLLPDWQELEYVTDGYKCSGCVVFTPYLIDELLGSVTSELFHWNDAEEKTFPEIADLVEQWWANEDSQST